MCRPVGWPSTSSHGFAIARTSRRVCCDFGRRNIEWTEATWNPVTGCTKISQGCKNCYAERMAKRLRAMDSDRYRNEFAVTLHPDLVDAPKRWRAPRLVFVNSMSDLVRRGR